MLLSFRIRDFFMGGGITLLLQTEISAGSWFDERHSRGLPADCEQSCDSVFCAKDVRGEQSTANLNKHDEGLWGCVNDEVTRLRGAVI